MKYRWAAAVALSVASITHVGCHLRDSKFNFIKDADLSHYQNVATQLEYPDANGTNDSRAINIPSPMDIGKDGEAEYWDMKLEEALQLALANSQVLNDIGGLVIRSPGNVNTIHSPAITETDPRFGVEAALSAFDTNFSYRAFVEKNDRALNNVFFGGGTRLLQQDLGTFQAQLQKRSATGGTFTLRNNTEYDANNAPGNLFPSAWNTNIETEFRQPLLQGAGQEFNRIQGPNSVLGLPSGVLIARVNTDVSLADFEAGLRDLVSNVENAYWDLYFAYRDLDAKITARESALDTWRKIQAAYATGRRRGEAEKEAEAREQYFRFKEEVQNAWSGRLVEGTHTNNGSSGGTLRASGGVRVAERRMRLIMGLPISDAKLIRPADEPRMAKVVFDWECVLPEALARRVELRRQKWVIKRRELELIAAKNFLLPTLDTVGRYRWRGFGHDLLNPDRQPDPFDNAWQNLTSGNFQEWQLGAELNIPLGFRKGHAGVRNAQLLVARERAVLNQQEREIAHDLSNQLAEVERAYEVTQTNYNRRAAAHEQLSAMNAAYEARNVDLDLVLNAQLRVADSDSRFFAALVEYGLAVKNLHYEKGSLLDYNEVYLAEGPWPDKAYNDAAKRESLMSKPWRLSYILQRPPLVSRGPVAQQTALAPSAPGFSQPQIEVLPDTATQPAEGLPAPNIQNGPAPQIQNAPAPSDSSSAAAVRNQPASFVAPAAPAAPAAPPVAAPVAPAVAPPTTERLPQF